NKSVSLKEPTITYIEIRALAAERISPTLDHLKKLFNAWKPKLISYEEAMKLKEIKSEMNNFEICMFERFSMYFMDQVNGELTISDFLKFPDYQEIINQDKIGETIAFVDMNQVHENFLLKYPSREEKVEAWRTAQRMAVERVLLVLDHLGMMAQSIEMHAKNSTKEGEESLHEIESRLSTYENHMFSRFFIHFIDQVEEEYGIPHQHSAYEQEIIDQDRFLEEWYFM
ncbi:hypothetical protein PFISCL1PPCAC_25771, partial [Pristionchus fissidentatus]